MPRLSIASICPRMVPADTEANLATLHRWAGAAADAGAHVAFFPETFIPGYIGDVMDDAPAGMKARFLASATPVPGPVTARLASWSRQLGIYLCAGLLEAAGARCHNTQVMICPGKGCIARYRKIQVAARETWFSRPGRGCPVVNVAGVPTGLLICRDKSYPEIARMLALNGAQLLLNPHSTCESKHQPFCDWSMKLCTARAMENGCYLIVNNNITDSDDMAPTCQAGYTFAIDPWGRTIHCDHAPGDRERMTLIEVDTDVVTARRTEEGVHFNLWSRHPEAYRRLVDLDPPPGQIA